MLKRFYDTLLLIVLVFIFAAPIWVVIDLKPKISPEVLGIKAQNMNYLFRSQNSEQSLWINNLSNSDAGRADLVTFSNPKGENQRFNLYLIQNVTDKPLLFKLAFPEAILGPAVDQNLYLSTCETQLGCKDWLISTQTGKLEANYPPELYLSPGQSVSFSLLVEVIGKEVSAYNSSFKLGFEIVSPNE